ncbi:cytochrome c oxidase subunit 7A2, mitochondrial [Agelaius phoeniceus]|uniref:cytochrome c oxidase subunit 7A2, mitochondrial n=1 Tax=Agelaius phoeniceus TaxID=39638 RepID=UPI004054C82D
MSSESRRTGPAQSAALPRHASRPLQVLNFSTKGDLKFCMEELGGTFHGFPRAPSEGAGRRPQAQTPVAAGSPPGLCGQSNAPGEPQPLPALRARAPGPGALPQPGRADWRGALWALRRRSGPLPLWCVRRGRGSRFPFRCPCCRREVTGPRAAMWRNVQALRQISQRTISTASRRLVNRVPENQKLFQEDNGLPVHLKGGAKDSLLYRTTTGLTLFGTMYAVYYLLVSSMPKKPN